MYFRLLETPLIHSLQTALVNARPETVVSWQLKKLSLIIVTRAVGISMAVGLVVNGVRYGVAWQGDWRPGLSLLFAFQVFCSLTR